MASNLIRQHKKASSYCIICSNNSKKHPTYSYFRFPKDEDRCNEWKVALEILDKVHLDSYTPEQCYERLRICSAHFEERMFSSMQKNRLKRDAVPTIFSNAKHSIGQGEASSDRSEKKLLMKKVATLYNNSSRETSVDKKRSSVLKNAGTPYQNLSQRLSADEKTLLSTENCQRTMKTFVRPDELSKDVPGDDVTRQDFKENEIEYFCETQYSSDNDSVEEMECSIEEIKCRTCMESTENGLPLDFTCFQEHSIKDAICHVIPELLPYLKDEDRICQKCFDILNTMLKFVENCLIVNKLLVLVEVSDEMTTSENEAEKCFSIAFENKNGPVRRQEAVLEKENGRAINGLPSVQGSVRTKEVKYQEDKGHSKVDCSINVEVIKEIESKHAGIEEECGINAYGKMNSPSLSQDSQEDADVERRNGNSKCTMFVSSYLHEDASIISIGGINEMRKACRIADDLGVPIEDKSTKYGNKRIIFIGNKIVWTCPICSATFNLEEKLQQHFVGQHKLSKAHLLTLKRYFYSKNASECFTCLQPFNAIKDKSKHVENCSVFNCPYCDKLMPVDYLTEHTIAKHADPKPFKCSTCLLEFESYKSLLEHIFKKEVKPSGPGKLTCRICKRRVDWENYKDHFNSHKTYSCKACSKKFTNKISLRTHQKDHKGESTLCPVCGKIFIATGLETHIRTVHEVDKQRDVLCHMCCSQFKTALTLRRHLKTVHSSETADCELCGKVFKHMHSLKIHYSLVHEKIVKHTCFICGKQFPRTDYYNNHMKVAHTKKDMVKRVAHTKTDKVVRSKRSNVNKCKYCGLVYNSASSRIRHEKLHKNNPNYIFRCNVCWKICSSQEMLDMHIATHKINFYCPLCEKPFGRKFALKTHLLEEHDGEKISEVKNMKRQSDITFQEDKLENHGYGFNEDTDSVLQIFVDGRSRYNKNKL